MKKEKYREVNLGSLFNIFTGRKNVNDTNPDGEYTFFSCAPETFKSNDYIHDGEAIIIAGNGSFTGTVRYFNGKFDLYQRTYAITPKEKDSTDTKYVFYQLKKFFEPRFMGGTRGSSIPYIVMGDISDFTISLPPLPEQKRIANILSSFDDKIELLREQNKTLENIAQTIFKQWFIDFNFPNDNGKPYKDSGGKMVDSELGMIPEGCEIKSLLDIADFINGLAMQNYRPEKDEGGLPVIKIRELKDGYSINTDRATKNLDAKYIVNNGDVVFSWSGSLELDLWKYDTGALNQHLFKVTSEKYPKWFYYHWIKHYLPQLRQIAEDKATTMGHIKRDHLKESLIVVPNKILRDNSKYFLMGFLFDKIITQNKTILNLENQKDILVNKLII
jgi:type I restriction enzyme S subunit